MNIYNILKNFKEFIEECSKNIVLNTKTGKEKVPQVVLGYLDEPKDEAEAKQEYPYIIIRYINDQVSEEATLRLKLIFGAYSKDNDGWVDLLHMMEVVKAGILKKEIFDFYTINLPIKSTIPEEQPYPYFVSSMELEFTIPRIESERMDEEWPT